MPGIRRWLEELIFVIALALALINIVLAGIFSSSLGQSSSLPETLPVLLPESTPGQDSFAATLSVEETATPQVLAQATDKPVTQTPSPLPAVTPTPNVSLPGLLAPTVSWATSSPWTDHLAPTRLLIPSIALDAPVEAVGWHIETQAGVQAKVWDAPLYFAVGWLNSSAPVGAPGNTVLDGHHNIYGEVFKNLINLNEGDTIMLYAGDYARDYRVDQKLLLEEAGQPLEARQANARHIQPTNDERLTLVTCWPYTGNSHRLIVIAFPIQP